MIEYEDMTIEQQTQYESEQAIHRGLTALQNMEPFLKEQHLKEMVNNFYYNLKANLEKHGYLVKE